MDLTFLGVLLGIGSAAAYGIGDFSGGLASRRTSPFAALTLSSIVAIAVLAAIVLFYEQRWPTWAGLAWALLAGLAGIIGLLGLYFGLARGHTALVAPGSGVIGAAVPVLFAALTLSLPDGFQTVGFGLAGLGIWLAASTGQGLSWDREGLVYTLVAGLGFGAFFIVIPYARDGGVVFAPLLIGRVLNLAINYVLARRQGETIPSLRQHPAAALAGVLDISGSTLYLFAQSYVRVDVAAVLASLFPAFTLLLTRLVLNEHLTRRQLAGAALCLIAAALIAL